MTFPARLIVIAILVTLLFLIVPRLIQRAVPEDPDCTWGASSLVWRDGHVIAGPDLTGCAP